MSTSDKLKALFEAAMLEPEPASTSRSVPLPRNPDGSQSGVVGDAAMMDDPEHFDPRREMLARVNRMNEALANE